MLQCCQPWNDTRGNTRGTQAVEDPAMDAASAVLQHQRRERYIGCWRHRGGRGFFWQDSPRHSLTDLEERRPMSRKSLSVLRDVEAGKSLRQTICTKSRCQALGLRLLPTLLKQDLALPYGPPTPALHKVCPARSRLPNSFNILPPKKTILGHVS